MNDNSTQGIQQVDDEETLFRRIVLNWIEKNEDGSNRLSSAAYYSRSNKTPRPDGISVDIASKTTPEKSIGGAPALVGLLAKVPKDLGNIVVGEPIEEDFERGIKANPAHALIKGKINKGRARKLARESSWVIKPR